MVSVSLFNSFTAAHPEAAATEPAATPTQGGTPAEGNGGWVEYWNDDVGAHYYYNHITGINQWDMPEELKSTHGYKSSLTWVVLKGLAGTTETTPDAETKVEGEQEKSEEKDGTLISLRQLITRVEFAWSEEEPLDSAKADQVISWANENEEGLQSLNNYFEDNSYVLGYTPTAHDNKLFAYV